ncbi:unnamed protein product (macronuclear) [Paramecium tetraurelia]|uniref:RAP domain-containing protein n=1 Tax=Paramecium tetraurelia TaxID=5888 RepID=A0CDV8_PARTE|nr:uncharacterized protein GSPATT00007187001 [Paramecium tetraurelia]CAK68975.1 unnamed protein product [Paramecium tetraurelia]|eukprot:XP_001436372.1 hypothetical protein (macronuclear) [Paramecium tetraurelia strain d4-2]
MLKILHLSKLSSRFLNKSIACFSQPFIQKEYQFISDDEADYEFTVAFVNEADFQHFANAQTIDEVIKVYQENNLTPQQIHFPVFQICSLLKRNPETKNELLHQFITENVLPNFETLKPSQCITVIVLLQKLQNKSYNAQIKKHIEQNLQSYNSKQLPHIFYFYSKQGWKMFHIGKILKQQLRASDFNIVGLCSIIRACYIESTQFKSIIHSDLAFKASKSLMNKVDDMTTPQQIAVFNQLAKMKLHQSTSSKQFPLLLYKLAEIFVQNLGKINLHSKLKLMESYQFLINNFPNTLFEVLFKSIEIDTLNSQNRLRLYINLKEQKSFNRLKDDKMQQMFNNIKFDEVTENNLLLKFLDVEFGRQNSSTIDSIIVRLNNAQNLNSKQKIEFLKVIIKQNKVSKYLDQIKITNDHLPRLIDQAYYCHRYVKSLPSQEQQDNIQESTQQLMERLQQLESKSKLSISHYILSLEPYPGDPFYEFINQEIKLDELPEKDYIHFLLRLNSQNLFNHELKTKSEMMAPSLDQLQSIINNISNIDYLNDKLVKQISKWHVDIANKSIIDGTFNIHLMLNLIFKIVLYTPLFALHTSRGTVMQPIRELLNFMSNQVSQHQGNLEVDLYLFLRFYKSFANLDVKTNLIFNICQDLCDQKDNFEDLEKLQIASIVTDLNPDSFTNLQVVNSFLSQILKLKMDNFIFIQITTKILLYQLKFKEKLNCAVQITSLEEMINQLKMELVQFNFMQNTKENYYDGLMTLLDYDAWRIGHQKFENDELSDFIHLHFQNLNESLNMKSMRPGLKTVIRIINQCENKYQFIQRYEKLFQQMFSKCKQLKNQEIPHIQACLDYIEFAKKLKLSNKDIFKFLINQIQEQENNLKPTQIVQIIQKFSEMKIYTKPFYDNLSNLIINHSKQYSRIELLDVMNAFAKLGYFNQELVINILEHTQQELQQLNNGVISVQTLWSILTSFYYFMKELNQNLFSRYEGIIVHLMQNVSQFVYLEKIQKLPIIFRQVQWTFKYLQVYVCLFEELNQLQQEQARLIIENGKSQVKQNIIPNQKSTQQFRSLMKFLDKNKIEYKMNYYFDSQYVDFYIETKRMIISVDNSLYVTNDMQQYTGFHYINKWILEGATKKYELKSIRIKAWQWLQMSEEQKTKILQL